MPTPNLLRLAPAFFCSSVAALGGCSSKPSGSDAGAAADEEALVSERGEDERFTWTSASVIDRTTGLIWQRRVDDVRRSFPEAEAFCRSFDAASFHDGRGAWRVPTRAELLTILDGDAEHPALGGKIDWYWSSTRSENITTAAWVVGIARYTNTHAFETQGPVRCVR